MNGGDVDVFMRKGVVDVVTNPLVGWLLKREPSTRRYELGDVVNIRLRQRTSDGLLRRQQKQVVVQRIRENRKRYYLRGLCEPSKQDRYRHHS